MMDTNGFIRPSRADASNDALRFSAYLMALSDLLFENRSHLIVKPY